MRYKSTRGRSELIEASEAILRGIAPDGGLYIPESVPVFEDGELETMEKMTYKEKAKVIFKKYLTDFTDAEIDSCVESAYTEKAFGKFPVELVKLGDSRYVLELWHGPTSAFKDMALQILPHFLKTALVKNGEQRTAVILVATSGDTGKAALDGFSDVDRTKIMVFYPSDGVSEIQKKQMATQEGSNVNVCAIKGNFDDAQTGVKKIFADAKTAEVLDRNGYFLSSANSINWGRLVPQIVYYVHSYCELVRNGDIARGEKINIVVPTGNFGNILAAYYAYMMGVPVNRFICASNANNVLTDFINTGKYEKNRRFYTTYSPSMDILVSSNLERMLYYISEGNTDFVGSCMSKLSTSGHYEISAEEQGKLSELFSGGYCDDSMTLEEISSIFAEFGYLTDTHTAVALKVYRDYLDKTGDTSKTVIASTASPYKFADRVLSGIGSEPADNECENLKRLEKVSGTTCPSGLASLEKKEIRFKEVCQKENMKDSLYAFLGIGE